MPATTGWTIFCKEVYVLIRDLVEAYCIANSVQQIVDSFFLSLIKQLFDCNDLLKLFVILINGRGPVKAVLGCFSLYFLCKISINMKFEIFCKISQLAMNVVREVYG